MLISAKAYAYSSPRASASSESSAIAGVQKLPKVMLATTTSAASTAARPGQGRAAVATADSECEHGHRPDAADAVRDPPDQRVRGCLEGGRAEPERADRESREAELVQAQRREHAQRPEEERGQDDEPDTEQDPAVAQRPQEEGERLGLHRWGRRSPERPDRKRDGEERGRTERQALPDDRGHAAEHRAEQRADDREGQRRPDRLAPAGGRCFADEPGQAAPSR